MTRHPWTECACGEAGCRECLELVVIARLLRAEFDRTTQHARVPKAEIVWWRAQMRAREEAARAAARPILVTQAIAIAALIGLVVSLAGRLTLPVFSWAGILATPAELPLLAIALAAAYCLVFAPLALYVAFSGD